MILKFIYIKLIPRLCFALTGLLWLGALSVRAADYYVATNGTGGGTSWADATNNLQGAISACQSNFTVWVSNGTYITNLTVGGGVTVRSKDNDPSTVILNGGYPAVSNRVVSNAPSSWLIGCTVTNGYLTLNPSPGGGVYRGSVSNCMISGNRALDNGSGGGANLCRLYNSTIKGNYVDSQGGGLSSCTGYNCTISENYGDTGGGGANNSTLYNCLLSGNTGGSGGGVRGGKLYNCLVTSNTGSGNGGGAHSAAGGPIPAILYNCTVASNTAPAGGGGYQCTFVNSISWGNSAVDNFSGGATNTNSCGVAYTGSGSITNDPLFVNPNAGIYRLQSSSPCINKGNNGAWAGLSNSVDLAGNLRIRFRRVDMGAYEWYPRIKVNGVPYERIRFINGSEPSRIDGIQ